MADKLVTIAQFPSYIEAEMAKQLLSDYGIEAVVTGDNTSNVYSGLSALTDVELQVFESQAQEAKEILESQQQELDEYNYNNDNDYDYDEEDEDEEDEDEEDEDEEDEDEEDEDEEDEDEEDEDEEDEDEEDEDEEQW